MNKSFKLIADLMEDESNPFMSSINEDVNDDDFQIDGSEKDFEYDNFVSWR